MAATKILLPNGDFLPAQSFTQDGETTKAQEIVVCDSAGNVVGVSANRLDVEQLSAVSAAGTASITANLQTVGLMDVSGYSSLTVAVSGTYAGVNFRVIGYNDGTGSSGGSVPIRDLGSGAEVITAKLSSNASRMYQVDIAGLTHVAILSTSYTSGTASLRLLASAAPTGAAATSAEPYDTQRTPVTFYASAVASGTTTTETAITLTKSSGASATSAAASWVPGSNSWLRITDIVFASRGHSTGTAQVSTFRIRRNSAGAVTTSSTPIVFEARTATPATALAWDRFAMAVDILIEGNGTAAFGVTANAVFTTNAPTWDVVLHGYEII